MIGTSVFPQSFTVRRRSEFEFATLASKRWSRVGGSLAYNDVDRAGPRHFVLPISLVVQNGYNLLTLNFSSIYVFLY